MKTINNLNIKQKIIIGIILSVIIGVTYYLYNKCNIIEIVNKEENLNEQKISIEESEENNIAKEIEEENIFIHISGAVNKEGIVKLKKNSRISDAIEKAEGLKEDANIKDINLAQILEDGTKIYIPNNKEQDEIEKQKNSSIQNNINTYEEKNIINSSQVDKKININTATQTELESLPRNRTIYSSKNNKL